MQIDSINKNDEKLSVNLSRLSFLLYKIFEDPFYNVKNLFI